MSCEQYYYHWDHIFESYMKCYKIWALRGSNYRIVIKMIASTYKTSSESIFVLQIQRKIQNTMRLVKLQRHSGDFFKNESILLSDLYSN